MKDKIEFIQGGRSIDDRGEIVFCNSFDFNDVKRFYTVSNHKAEFIRAWHGHKNEAKYVYVISGAAVIAAVKIDNWDKPNKNAEVKRYVLSEHNPGILRIPNGYANGFKTLLKNTKIMFFSTSYLEDSLQDDYRYNAYYWNPWDIEER